MENIREITGQYPQSLAGLNTDTFSPSDPQPAEVLRWLKRLKITIPSHAKHGG